MSQLFRARTCCAAWLEASTFLLKQKKHVGYNLVLDIADPVSLPPAEKQVVGLLDALLGAYGKDPVCTVAGTIFPASHYLRAGAKGVFEEFPAKIYPKIQHGWGTYAGRMLRRVGRDGSEIRPLEMLVDKIRRLHSNFKAIYDLSLVDVFTDIPLYDPSLDATRTIGQPCLSHLTFKVIGDDQLMLTALYRNHYYIQRALGNLLGLAQLLYFVAQESGLKPASLVCHSTYARIDTDGGWGISRVSDLLGSCQEALSSNQDTHAELGQGQATRLEHTKEEK